MRRLFVLTLVAMLCLVAVGGVFAQDGEVLVVGLAEDYNGL